MRQRENGASYSPSNPFPTVAFPREPMIVPEGRCGFEELTPPPLLRALVPGCQSVPLVPPTTVIGSARAWDPARSNRDDSQ